MLVLGKIKKELPSSLAEQQMQVLWAVVLQISAADIGANDSFFQLGGDSIAAMRLVSAARAAGISLTMAQIFQQPSLSELCMVAKNATLAPDPLEKHLDFQRHIGPYEPALSVPISAVLPPISAEDIDIIIESTDFQLFAVSHGALRSRGFTNYLILDFRTPIETARLQASCHSLIMQHEILRTVFLVHDLKLLQVILRRPPFQFSLQECETHLLDSFCQELIRRDQESSFVIGELITKFFAIISDSCCSRLIIRLSHAQYDAASIKMFFGDLEKFLCGQKPEIPRQFSSFIQTCRTFDTSAAKKYWSKYLKGSSMTTFCLNSSPEKSAESDTKVVRQIPNVNLNSHNITFSTILQTAWAIVLSRLSHRNDIVFGQLVSSRILPIDNIDKTTGPCVNIIPVRVKLQKSVQKLLRNVQEQLVLGIPHQHIGFESIRKQCTEWPAMTRLSSVVQHQNVEDIPARPSSPGMLYTMTEFISPTNCVDVWVISTVKRHSIEISLGHCLDAISASFAANILDDLCDTIQYLSGNFYGELLSEFETIMSQPQIPIVLSTNTELQSLRHPYTHQGIEHVLPLVEKTWAVTFNRTFGHLDTRFDVHFSRFCDDLLGAIQISRSFGELSVRIDMDDVLANPTMRSQAHFIAGKL
ncbi:nonribosomal peptide synthase [Aspergillus luchuensis]|uniref:Nonribosomal peptide synthase n=1 Tax=Aspergillus kawachii TaxID=1069201 RepID=A0A146F088_ASPKA|nr:nonribosomal peptide synthase [Aspergillus luchuensis]